GVGRVRQVLRRGGCGRSGHTARPLPRTEPAGEVTGVVLSLRLVRREAARVGLPPGFRPASGVSSYQAREIYAVKGRMRTREDDMRLTPTGRLTLWSICAISLIVAAAIIIEVEIHATA